MGRNFRLLCTAGLLAGPLSVQAALVTARIWDPVLADGLSGLLQYDTAATIDSPTVEFDATGELLTLAGWTLAPVTRFSASDQLSNGDWDLGGVQRPLYVAMDPEGTAGLLGYERSAGLVSYVPIGGTTSTRLEIYNPTGPYGDSVGPALARWPERTYTTWFGPFDVYSSNYEIATVPLPGGLLLLGSAYAACLYRRPGRDPVRMS